MRSVDAIICEQCARRMVYAPTAQRYGVETTADGKTWMGMYYIERFMCPNCRRVTVLGKYISPDDNGTKPPPDNALLLLFK